MAALVAAIEGLRWVGGPAVWVDGREIGLHDPFPEDEYLDRTVDFR